MGLLFNDREDFKKDVEEKFGKEKNYLIVFKHNSPVKNVLKLIVSNLYNTYDSNRTYILVFDNKGIYEKEISNSDKANFFLMPENEIDNFTVNKKSNKAYINFTHIGKEISYEIPFTGKLFTDNKNNYKALLKKDWERI